MHIHIKQTKNLGGFATENVGPGGTAKILARATLTSDEPEFYKYTEQLANIFLTPAGVFINAVHQFLVVRHQDQSADVYVNDFPATLQMRLKGEVKKGAVITHGDIADIHRLRFPDIVIERTDKVVYCFKVGWRFGLFFDLFAGVPSTGDSSTSPALLQIDEMEVDLGGLYRYLSFYHVYKTLEPKSQFQGMLQDGWFPFVEILAGDFQSLSEAYESKFDLENKVNGIVNRFKEERISKVTDRWWENEHFLKHQVQIQAGVNAYLQDTQDGFVNCIKNLWTEMEGVLRDIYYNETGQANMSVKELISHITSKAKKRSGSDYSLLLALPFYEYLRDVAFPRFDVESGNIVLSRHTSSHGVANAEQYTKARALQLILILDQVYFFS